MAGDAASSGRGAAGPTRGRATEAGPVIHQKKKVTNMALKGLDAAIADALIGIDTLWGGDVMNPSGTGRFIADCWFSDEPLPVSYTHSTAAVLRENGGAGA